MAMVSTGGSGAEARQNELLQLQREYRYSPPHRCDVEFLADNYASQNFLTFTMLFQHPETWSLLGERTRKRAKPSFENNKVHWKSCGGITMLLKMKSVSS